MHAHRIFALVVILFWSLLGGYVGVSGLIHEENRREEKAIEISASSDKVIYDGIVFSSKEKLQSYLNQTQTMEYFSWIQGIPELLMLVLSSCALGAFGGAIQVVKRIAIDKVPAEETAYLAIPFLGLLIGMLVLAASFLIPKLLIEQEDFRIKQTTLMCFSLFAGLFSDRFLNWMEKQFGNLLSSKNDEEA